MAAATQCHGPAGRAMTTWIKYVPIGSEGNRRLCSHAGPHIRKVIAGLGPGDDLGLGQTYGLLLPG